MTDARRSPRTFAARAASFVLAGFPRSLYALMLVVPLMGARDCERVVVGHECDGGTCAPDEGCTYAGEHHDVGDGFPSEDGCNSCSCQEDGQVVCTLRACADDVCGGIANLPCASGEYCKYPADALCGAADRTGTCEAIPQVCADIFDPVCGCDDKTYPNACEAAGQGVSVAREGECAPSGGGDTCGGLLGGQCKAGEYCNFPEGALCGAADATGTCQAIPQACDLILDPVCGCDDKTYDNACAAALNGISVAQSGECGSTGGGNGEACGGLAGLPCGADEYCSYPPEALCGAADQTGTCQPIPQACDAIYDPVCGCDDMTYGNTCEAATASVSVASKGECDSTGGGSGATCGVRGAEPCPAGEFCNFTLEAQCAAADHPGTCETIPQACTREYLPVCGCDGVTYGNECMANAEGIAVASEGECDGGGTGSGDTCGGLTGAACASGEFCNYPIEAQCGAADQTGTCETIPQACTLQYDPVCGCDGMTYANDCAAASASVSIVSRGECP